MVALLAIVPAAYGAEGDPPCLADTERLCSQVPGAGGWIQGCLERHMDDLSPECRKHVGQTYDTGEKIKDACDDDIDRYCDDDYRGYGGGQRVACLVKNRDSVSARCRKALDDAAPKDDVVVQDMPPPTPTDDAAPKPAKDLTPEAELKADAEQKPDAEPKVE